MAPTISAVNHISKPSIFKADDRQKNNMSFSSVDNKNQNIFYKPYQPPNRTTSESKLQKNPSVPKRTPPCIYPLWVQREWEDLTGRKWHNLGSH